MATKMASTKKKIPSTAKGMPYAAPNRPMSLGHSRPSSNGEDRARHRAHREEHCGDLRPTFGQQHGLVVVPPKAPVVGEQHEEREGDPERDQDDVEAQGEG